MATHSLYNGEVELVFDEGRHVYTVDGEPVASVTGILSVINKPALLGWASKMTADYWLAHIKPGRAYDEIDLGEIYTESKRSYRKTAGQAASVGTIVHQFAEDTINGENPAMPVNKQAKKNCNLFLEWFEKHKVKAIEPEFKIYSTLHGYAGTCDLDCTIDGKRTLLDFKNSSGIYPEAYAQTAAYAQARQEELPVQYDQRAVINFNKKTGKVDIKYRDMANEFVTDMSAFMGALQIHRWQQGMKKK